MILFLDIETVPLEVPEDADAESIKKLSLSACTARVLCLGYALDGRDSEVAAGDEATILAHFWELARTANLFVGFNVLNFDLKFLWQRSMIVGVKPSRELPFTRFRQAPVYDVMEEWSKWGRDHVSLDVFSQSPWHRITEGKWHRWVQGLSIFSRQAARGDSPILPPRCGNGEANLPPGARVKANEQYTRICPRA